MSDPVALQVNLGIAPRMLRERETAELLNVSQKTLAQWRYQGKGPLFVKVGSAVRYDRKDVLKYIDQCREDIADTENAQVHSDHIEPLIDEHRAAEYIGLKVKTLRAWRLYRKHLNFYRIGRCIRYASHDLHAFMNKKRRGTKHFQNCNE